MAGNRRRSKGGKNHPHGTGQQVQGATGETVTPQSVSVLPQNGLSSQQQVQWNENVNEVNMDSLAVPVGDEVPVADASPAGGNPSELGSTISTAVHQRRVIRSLWQTCCTEVATELSELNGILTKLGLPAVNYCKDKTYLLTDYDEAPDIENCKSKDFLDFYVFPILLPGIQSLIQFAKVNRVFQCRYCSFNSMDYVVEYLYNNNPRYPQRLESPTPLFEIPFVRKWLAKYPRPALPKWLTMTEDEAATIIQRVVRGFLVRVRPDVQEMRLFWKVIKQDLEDELWGKEVTEEKPKSPIFSPYYSEISGEWDAHLPEAKLHHSDSCVVCSRFKGYVQSQKTGKNKNSRTGSGIYPESAPSDFYEDENEEDIEGGGGATTTGASTVSGAPPPTLGTTDGNSPSATTNQNQKAKIVSVPSVPNHKS